MKKKCVFVGSFEPGADGTVGGQLFACRSLIDSPISNEIDFVLIDSTQRSLPPPALPIRLLLAIRRVLQFTKACWSGSVKSTLVFSSFRCLSLAEKMVMLAVGRLLGKRTLVSFRSEITSTINGYFIIYPLVQIGIFCADAVICQSHEAEHNLIKLFPKSKSKIKVIPNWIDTSKYHPIAQQRFSKVAKGGSPCKLLFLGWIEQFKGVYILANVFRKLVLDGSKVTIEFVGSGSEVEGLREFFHDNSLTGEASLRGWLKGDDKLEAIANADILVLPSLSEGMPNALLEAMASGLPVIATSVGGIPELVQDGQHGILVRANDEVELRDAIKTLVNSIDMRNQFGLNGHRAVLERHSIESAWPIIAHLLLAD
jgi:glycosyltransferase involved in cell wall biosynthesis